MGGNKGTLTRAAIRSAPGPGPELCRLTCIHPVTERLWGDSLSLAPRTAEVEWPPLPRKEGTFSDLRPHRQARVLLALWGWEPSVVGCVIQMPGSSSHTS